MDVEASLVLRDKAAGVLQRYAAHASKAQHETERLHGSLEHVSHATGELRNLLLEVGAAFGVGLGVKKLWESFVGTNAELQKTQRNLGGMISGLYQFGRADPSENLKLSMERAAEMMETYEKAAARSGTPVSALVNMTRALAPAMARVGKGTEDVERITLQVARLARQTGTNYEEAAHTIAMFVQYGFAGRGVLAATLGLRNREFHLMSQQQRLAFAMSKIRMFAPENTKEILTFEDLMGRARAIVEQIARVGGKPLFDAAVRSVTQLGDWLEKNRGTLEKIGQEVANKFVVGLNLASSAASLLAGHIETVFKVMQAMAAIKIAKELGAGELVGGFGAGKIGQAIGTAFQGVAAGYAALQIGQAIGAAFYDFSVKTPALKRMFGIVGPEEIKAAQEALDRAARYRHETDLAAGRHDIYRLMGRTGMGTMDEIFKFLEGAQHLSRAQLDLFGLFGGPAEVERLLRLKEELTPKPGEKPRGPVNNFYNSRFDITQQFAPGFDPDRIAVAFTNDLATLIDRKMQSPGHYSAAGAPVGQ